MKTTLALFICLLSVATAFAQPDTLWTRTFGGSESDVGRSVQQTIDGGFIIAGGTSSFGAGEDDVYLIKTDGSGNEQWEQTYGGSDNDWGYSVQQTSDGGYIIAGKTASYGAGSNDFYLVKTDVNGNESWTQTFGGSDSDGGYCVQQTVDGGYIIVGNTGSFGSGSGDVYLIKTDSSGYEQWSQTFGGSNVDHAYSVQQTTDGGYIVTGYTYSFGSASVNVYLIKTDSSGYEQWSQTLGGNCDDLSHNVQQTRDGGYIIVGRTLSYGASEEDIYLIKTDGIGNEQWYQTFGGEYAEEGYSVQQTSDGGYIITGWTSSFGPGYAAVYLIKTDGSGNVQWNQTFGGGIYNIGYSVQQTADGGYIIAGRTSFWGASGDVYLIRLAPDSTGVIDLDLPQPITYSLLPAYPNPFNPSTLIRFQIPVAGNVQIQVFDIQGNVVATLTDGWQIPGSYQLPFDASHLSSGIYLTRFTAGDFTQTQKLVLIK